MSNKSIDSSQEVNLFTPKNALEANNNFWGNVVEEMNNRAINLLALHFSETIKQHATFPDRMNVTHKKPREVRIQLETGVHDYEAPIIEVALNQKVDVYPPLGSEEFQSMYETGDARVDAFLTPDNLQNVYQAAIDRLLSVGWEVQVPDGFTKLGFPQTIIFSTK